MARAPKMGAVSMPSASLARPNVRVRAGVLWPVAERFAAQARLPCPESTPAAASLRGLGRAIARFLDLEHVSPAAEHEFVEGAGALLGVVLMRHFEGARHRSHEGKHRVQLGAHGFFDPFAAIERTLASDDPLRALAQEVAVAEAEHRSEGPVSRVVHGLTRRIASDRPELRLVAHFDLGLSLAHPDLPEPFEVDLARAVDSTRGQSAAAVERVVGRLVSMLPGQNTPAVDLLAARDRLLPRLGRTDQLAELSSRASAALFSAPLAGELSVALQLEVDGRARYLRRLETERAGLSEGAAVLLALDNLASRSARFRLVREEWAGGALFVARTGDGLDSARMLLPELHALLLARVGSAVCLGIPHRDTFFACAATDAASVSELARRTEQDAARAPHRLSARLFQLTAPGRLAAN